MAPPMVSSTIPPPPILFVISAPTSTPPAPVSSTMLAHILDQLRPGNLFTSEPTKSPEDKHHSPKYTRRPDLLPSAPGPLFYLSKNSISNRSIMTKAPEMLPMTTSQNPFTSMKLEKYSYQELIFNHSLITIVGLSLLILLSMASIVLYLSARHCRKGTGQLLLFFYAITLIMISLVILLGFHHPPFTSSSPDVRLSCVFISVLCHVFILLSFGLLACYGAHIVYRACPYGRLPNLFAAKSILPTVAISIALPIALSVLKPQDYIDESACCFPNGDIALFAVFLPMVIITLTNLCILAVFPCIYSTGLPQSEEGSIPYRNCCCNSHTSDDKLDWSPVYNKDTLDGAENRTARVDNNAFTDFARAYKGKPTCLHALAVIGLGFLEGAVLIIFYISYFSPSLGPINSNSPFYVTLESKNYQICFLVLTFLLGISLLLEMATLEDESLKACKSCCFGRENVMSYNDDVIPEAVVVPPSNNEISTSSQPAGDQQNCHPGCQMYLVAPQAGANSMLNRAQQFSLSLPQLKGLDQPEVEDDELDHPTKRQSNSTSLPRAQSQKLTSILKTAGNHLSEDETYDNLPEPRRGHLTNNPHLSKSARMINNSKLGLMARQSRPNYPQVKFRDEYSDRHIPAFSTPYYALHSTLEDDPLFPYHPWLKQQQCWNCMNLVNPPDVYYHLADMKSSPSEASKPFLVPTVPQSVLNAFSDSQYANRVQRATSLKADDLFCNCNTGNFCHYHASINQPSQRKRYTDGSVKIQNSNSLAKQYWNDLSSQ